MALGKDRTRVNIKGGGVLEHSTNDSVWNILGYLGETKFVDDIAQEDVHDEAGDLVNVLSGNRTPVLTSTLLQTTKEEIDVLRDNIDTVVYLRLAYGREGRR